MNMDSEKLSDEELIKSMRLGNESAAERLIEKYKPLVKKNARLYYLEGGDHEDLLQEGMLGLYKAIKEFDFHKETSFPTFASLLVNRQMLSAIEAAGRKKHKMLNESVPLDTLDKTRVRAQDPEVIFIEHEEVSELLRSIEECLSPMERKVLGLYLDGLDYREIAEKMKRSEKSIDNALQRIRSKLKGSLKSRTNLQY